MKRVSERAGATMGRSAVGRCRERRGRFNSHDNPIALSRPVNTNPSGRNRQNVPTTGLSGLRNSGDPRPVLTLRRRTRDLVVPQQLLEQRIGQRLGRAEVAIATNAENSHRHGRSQNCRERGGGAATAVVGVTDSRLTAPDRKCSRPRSWIEATTAMTARWPATCEHWSEALLCCWPHRSKGL